MPETSTGMLGCQDAEIPKMIDFKPSRFPAFQLQADIIL